ncbi:MAG: ThiF family adenylyltransferase [Pseudomonadota bacterium]
MLAELLGQLSGLIDDVFEVPSNLGAAAEGNLDTDAGDVRIRVILVPGFPFTPPRVEILEEGIPRCPPLMRDRVLCWQDTADMLVDHARPLAVLAHCLVQVRRLLDHALHELPWVDIMAEYEVYWGQRSSEHLFVAGGPTCPEPTALAHTPGRFPMLHPKPGAIDAVLVPLAAGILPMPPEGRITVAWVREHLLTLLSPASRDLLTQMLSTRGRKFRQVVFQIPRSNGLPIHLGVQVRCGRGMGHPLLNGPGTRPVMPFSTSLWDVDFFRERGGAEVSFKSARVLVVGCGAVGGHVALDLARSGVGHLTLVDPDHLAPENTFRHALGMGVPYLNKALQLALHITASFPGVVPQPVPTTVEAALATGDLDLATFDAVVVAVDRPAGAQAVNVAAWKSGGPPTVLHAWLEAYGLASHVLRTHPGVPGCFECLVRDTETGKLVENRASLAAPGQDFLKDQAGCGGRYVPFGAVHASRTAVLAVEETLKGLGGERVPALVTWCGDSRPFLEAGYRLSDRGLRWEEGKVVDIARAESFVSGGCPVCGP